MFTIFAETAKEFDLIHFPDETLGVFGPLRRVQRVHMAIQRCIIAAKEKIIKALET